MRAKKSLGQNFLKSKQTLDDIVDVSKITDGDLVLEIGPGKGALTNKLLKRGAEVLAIEKDDRLIPLLEEKFEKEIKENKLKVLHEDVLDFNFEILKNKKYKLVANIPYYITGKILPLFLTSEHQPELITLMVQKEVADRIVAKNGKESVLSISTKVFGQPKYVQTVDKKYFSPVPKVDSAILQISHISRAFFKDLGSEKRFFGLLKAGFSSKRKKLSNNIDFLFKKDDLNTREILKKCGLEENVRAENLALGEWKCLLENLEKRA